MSAISPTLNWQASYPPIYNTRRTASSSAIHSLSLARSLTDVSIAAKDPALFGLHERLDKIAELQNNWDGHGSIHPDALSVWKARQLLEDAHRQTVSSVGWQNPYISASEDGEIVLEWWNGNRKLTMYVGPQQTSYITSRGPHVVDDMEDGLLPEDGISSLWAWLFE